MEEIIISPEDIILDTEYVSVKEGTVKNKKETIL